MDLEKIESELKKMVGSLDKGIHFETIVEEKDEFHIFLSKGSHSDRASLSKALVQDFIEQGKGGQEVRKAIGKIISKINRMAQRRI